MIDDEINNKNHNKVFPKCFSTKEKYYYKMVDNFFKNFDINIMVNIVDGQSKISLRILDWFVTSYSKKKKISYDIENNDGSKDNFNVHINYKAQLKSYTKKYFDPFRRKKKFYYISKKEENIYTTIGQLNFFRWAINNNVIKHVEQNYEKIVKEMNKANKENKKLKEKKKEKLKLKENNNFKKKIKKNKIIVEANSYINNDELDIVLTFE